MLLAVLLAWGIEALSRQTGWQAFGALVERGSPRQRRVALSFDDGPNPRTTPALLAALGASGSRASFFLVGKHMAAQPEQVRAIVGGGHQLGNHSYSHGAMVWERPQHYQRELERTDALIRQAGYRGAIAFRPPYGRRLLVLPWLLARQGRLSVFWDVDPEDWAQSEPERIVSQVMAQVKPGSIVLLHERPATVQALGPLIRQLHRQGYQLVRIDELLQAPAARGP